MSDHFRDHCIRPDPAQGLTSPKEIESTEDHTVRNVNTIYCSFCSRNYAWQQLLMLVPPPSSLSFLLPLTSPFPCALSLPPPSLPHTHTYCLILWDCIICLFFTYEVNCSYCPLYTLTCRTILHKSVSYLWTCISSSQGNYCNTMPSTPMW